MALEATAGPGWWGVAILTFGAAFTIFGMAGSFLRSRSSEEPGEDGYWFFGFYNNPNDDSVLVKIPNLPQLTANLGNPLGLGLMLLVLAIVLVLDVVLIVTM